RLATLQRHRSEHKNSDKNHALHEEQSKKTVAMFRGYQKLWRPHMRLTSTCRARKCCAHKQHAFINQKNTANMTIPHMQPSLPAHLRAARAVALAFSLEPSPLILNRTQETIFFLMNFSLSASCMIGGI